MNSSIKSLIKAALTLFWVVLHVAMLQSQPMGKWDNRTGKLKGIRILVYTKNGEGFVHKNIPANVDMLRKMAEKHSFEMDVSDDPAVFTDENLKKYRAIVFANTNNDVFDTDAQKVAFMRYTQAGGGFVGIHSVTGTERKWPWFKQLAGGTFYRHPPFQKYETIVLDASHPSMKPLPARWEVEDECYYLRDFNPAVRVLLVHDLSTVTDEKGPKPDIFGDIFPAVWCNTHDGGRQWCTSLGHADASYVDPLFIAHVTLGLQWAVAGPAPDYKKAYTTVLEP
ncbi:MAG: ThuA domain-containing protein [Cyclobacteriaceae bacterium]|nr:ThuA domain-containing protein [Cyclobacteriaceae bacterium]